MRIPKIMQRGIQYENITPTAFGYVIERTLKKPWYMRKARYLWDLSAYLGEEKGEVQITNLEWLNYSRATVRVRFVLRPSLLNRREWELTDPSTSGKYLITDSDGVVDTRYYDEDKGWFTVPDQAEVIAWAYLPTSYMKEQQA